MREYVCVHCPSIFIFGWKSGPKIAASCNDQYDNNNFIDKDVIVPVLLDRKFTSPLLFTHAFSCVSSETTTMVKATAPKKKTIRRTISQSKIISKKNEWSLLFYYSVPFSLSLHSHFWYLRFLYFFRSFVPILLNRLLYCKLIFAHCEMWMCACVCVFSLFTFACNTQIVVRCRVLLSSLKRLVCCFFLYISLFVRLLLLLFELENLCVESTCIRCAYSI